MISLFLFVLGAILGSFLNVCALRLPRGESIVRPRSRCPRCLHLIAWYDNIPVLSFLVLGARCRNCLEPISARYPAVEIASGLLLMGLWRRWDGHGLWFLAAYAEAAVLLVVSLIDWDTFLIPDAFSLGLLAAGLAASPFNPYFGGGAAWRIGTSLLGAAAGFLMCWGIALLGKAVFKKEAMGGGDVKLLAAVGAWSGVLGAFDCLMAASLLGSIYGVALMARGRLKRQDPVPFGPFLAAGAALNLFYLIPFGFPFL